MKKLLIIACLSLFELNTFGQVIIGPKGTKISLDSSKWKLDGNNIFNKNPGKIGIGTSTPTSQLHTTGDVRFEGLGTNVENTKIVTTDASGNITTRLLSNMLSGNAVTSVNGLTNSNQSFQTALSGNDFSISSIGSIHTFNLPSASASNRGALTSSDWLFFNGKENVLTFSNGLSRNVNTITVNTTQNINTLSNLTTDGIVKTSEGTGKLSIASAGIDYSPGTSSLGTGILKTTAGTGSLSIANASDFPILNQNTTGNAATVTTNANLTGPVTSIGNATSISANVISNEMLSQVPSEVFKGRASPGNGNVEDLTPTQATAILSTFSSTSKGLVPPSGGGTVNFLRADGIFAPPPGNSGRNIIVLAGDVVNTSTTLQDVSGLSFNVLANTFYRFYAIIPYTSGNKNNGSLWTILGPTPQFISYISRYSLSENTETINYCSDYNQPTSANQNSALNANIAIIQGVLRTSANGTVQIKFASATNGVSITAKNGATLEYW